MEDLYILFENYLSNKLTEEEVKNFEYKLQNDPSFNEKFTLYKQTHVFLENKFKNENVLNEFIQNTEKISASYFNKIQKRKNKFWLYGVAASIILLIGFFLFNPATPTYEEYITYPTIDFTTRGNQFETIKNAEDAFNQKEFSKASSIFSKLLTEEPNNSEFLLYKAFSLIELNQFKEADSILIKVSQSNSIYKPKALWHLALSKLKQKDYTACKQLLQEIPKEDLTYKKAQQLISKLPSK